MLLVFKFARRKVLLIGNQNGDEAEVRKKHSVAGYYPDCFMKLVSMEVSKTFQLLPCQLPALLEWQVEEFSEL